MENKNRHEEEYEVTVPEEGITGEDSFEEEIVIPETEDNSSGGDENVDIADLLQRYLPDFAVDDAAPSEEFSEDYADDAADVEYTAEIYAEESGEYVEEIVYEVDPDEYSDEELVEDGEVYYDEDAYEQPAEEQSDLPGYDDEEYSPEVDDYSAYEYVSDEAAYNESAGLNAEPEIPEDSELDATDINLMVAFGLDEELAKTMGAEVAAKLTEEIHAEAREREEKVDLTSTFYSHQ